ncbi:MerR family transcriptional regulator [Rhodococcus spelaei]|uniref:MerR family transcriptional regulator n=1 Tax=Rhodococcus spelaei TaxID=2546320 RepID=A0A541BLQ9_9NOCA|nr:MerR family transcriptional regulator [Rhodococcus spelaei]TQF73239.1 MerR family transcriptional regulator [Rhodococcus spelaei]
MTGTPRLMSIGEFSTATRISVRMLRHYDAHGVLVPAAVDAITGYRRYRPEQTAVAARVRRLRDVGFGVSAIGALLTAADTPGYVRALRIQRHALAEEVERARTRLAALDRMLDESSEETTMTTADTTTVELADMPAHTLVCLRGTVANYAAEGELWQRFLPALQQQGIEPGLGGCIEHDGEFLEADVDESVFVTVPDGTRAEQPLVTVTVPARRVVVATVTGAFAESIPRAHDAIAVFLAEHGLSASRTEADVTTHHFNVYVDDPSSTPEQDVRTAVYMPVR